MSNFDKALVQYLNAQTGLTALVGTRIYPMKLPQNVAALPAITFQRVGEPPAHRIHGAASILPKAAYQFTVWSDTIDKAVSAAAQLRLALDGKRGVWGTGDAQITVHRSAYEDMRDEYDPEVNLFYKQLDFTIMHD